MSNKHSATDLKQMQSLPLEAKIRMTKERIKVWYESWVRYEIYNKKTEKTRFLTIDTRDVFVEPELKENEWIVSVVDGQVYVSFSGGKDSTVLADLCARVCREYGWTLYLLFANTGLEYPEIQKFVKTYAEWLRKEYEIEVVLDIVRPEMRFDEVVKKYGYPVVSKEVSHAVYGARNSIRKGVYSHRLCQLGVRRDEYGGLKDDGQYDYDGTLNNSLFKKTKWRFLLDADFDMSSYCCDAMKKKPAKQYEKETGRKPIIGTMAWESQNRKTAWIKNGCNAFDAKRQTSQPLSFWTEQDILQYITTYNIPYCSVYGDIIGRDQKTNEIFSSSEVRTLYSMIENESLPDVKQNIKLETTGCDRTGCIFCMYGCHREKAPNRFQRLKETHPRQYEYCINGGEMVDGKWQPSKEGLGLGKVLDYIGVKY